MTWTANLSFLVLRELLNFKVHRRTTVQTSQETIHPNASISSTKIFGNARVFFVFIHQTNGGSLH